MTDGRDLRPWYRNPMTIGVWIGLATTFLVAISIWVLI